MRYEYTIASRNRGLIPFHFEEIRVFLEIDFINIHIAETAIIKDTIVINILHSIEKAVSGAYKIRNIHT